MAIEMTREQFHRAFAELRGKSREFLQEQIEGIRVLEDGRELEATVIEDPDVPTDFMAILLDEVEEAPPPVTTNSKRGRAPVDDSSKDTLQ